jgi:hypothetical protein
MTNNAYYRYIGHQADMKKFTKPQVELWWGLKEHQRKYIANCIYDYYIPHQKFGTYQFLGGINLERDYMTRHEKITSWTVRDWKQNKYDTHNYLPYVIDTSIKGAKRIEDLKIERDTTIGLLVRQMIIQFHNGNLISNHIRIAPNGKKYIPMKRIIRRYV